MRATASYCSVILTSILSTALPFSLAFAPPTGTLSTISHGKLLFSSAPSTSSTSLRASSLDEESVAETIEDTIIENTSNKQKRVAILLCPAQFCVPKDYENLLAAILEDVQHRSKLVDVVATRVAPLPRTEWIKVAKQLPTKNFLDANLSVRVTLDWYFEAMEQALAEMFAEAGEDIEICVVGHSIGGWVARAYIGGLSGSSTAVHCLAKEKITSLITLGTPHISPESALVDQTRGLLREIAQDPSCSSTALHDRGVKITCVGSSGLAGNLLTSELEELIAATSYLPLIGRLGKDVRGDGIVPTDLAFMDAPARRVVIEKCLETGSPVRHAHVLPTPWNLWDGSAPSWELPEEITWYGSPGVVSQWFKYIE
mmetsp:Transcript_7265/g.14914  ORF Transcript_7265/g.14914 Transcript_7265/m.14914 type:complete len:371 (-) Transcript_7265:277-1389(-)|eukprot:CAMPEP_0171348434 /NCGR_PEP_ID=MMETSP0878-20121228/30823_1 /TAXON_ID=67004 /ORGANISM="Thalassiosira weissflogii, Strain CCMP1336" /LENGTH=370 /DNA_ID=CAMNT_0011852765 /DNA_START=83 /DNA_END=1195 /DNA_ORIENTATION=+